MIGSMWALELSKTDKQFQDTRTKEEKCYETGQDYDPQLDQCVGMVSSWFKILSGKKITGRPGQREHGSCN